MFVLFFEIKEETSSIIKPEYVVVSLSFSIVCTVYMSFFFYLDFLSYPVSHIKSTLPGPINPKKDKLKKRKKKTINIYSYTYIYT